MTLALRLAVAVALIGLAACARPESLSSEPSTTSGSTLPSWSEGPSKTALTSFVSRVTTPANPDFVAASERIAVFDNDGTLWTEQPMYVQLAFALDRVKALAAQHPEWQTREPFKSAMTGDLKAVASGGEHALSEIIAASHAGNTTGEFEQIVQEWVKTAKHPKTGRLYIEMVYQPMIEVLDYLRANGFKTYIVSGGGVEFMRPWVEDVYGIPPEQVIGSRSKMKYEVRAGTPVLARLAEIDLIDDKAGKPVGIQQVIGRRPTIAFGNSDGDFEMLEWTTTAAGPRLGVIVHHTDAQREWAYDRESSVGHLARGLDEAAGRGWVVVDMKEEWARIFPWAE
jgi:phosphoglycolate phosphatase-like HAD superfamily hydrolase